jgi:amino acid transporter
MAAVSVAFILETDNLLVTAVSAGLTVTAFLIVLAFLIHQIRQPSPKKLPQ